MKYTSFAILTALACMSAPFLIGQALAQKADAPSPTSRLDAFVGDGVCVGHRLAEGKPPGPAKPGRVHGEKSLDGHWVVVRYEEEPTADNPRPYKVAQYFGYDRKNKQFVTVALANAIGNYYVGTSPGWKGNTIAFEQLDLANGKPAPLRDIFTTGETGMVSHVGFRRDQRGRWVKTDEETCHQGPAKSKPGSLF